MKLLIGVALVIFCCCCFMESDARPRRRRYINIKRRVMVQRCATKRIKNIYKGPGITFKQFVVQNCRDTKWPHTEWIIRPLTIVDCPRSCSDPCGTRPTRVKTIWYQTKAGYEVPLSCNCVYS